jgi:hypothetical protein
MALWFPIQMDTLTSHQLIMIAAAATAAVTVMTVCKLWVGVLHHNEGGQTEVGQTTKTALKEELITLRLRFISMTTKPLNLYHTRVATLGCASLTYPQLPYSAMPS